MWGGGEIWHSMFAARNNMREYTCDLEAKIRECRLLDGNSHFILVLCGEGFHWRLDALEDFVVYYRNGQHRADDPFSEMERYVVEDRHIVFDQTISSFACLSRPQFAIWPHQLIWDVKPPNFPHF